MRKPRDIDAELKALAERQRMLKTRKVTQFGELVVATGADAIDPETLAGVLLDAVAAKDAGVKEAWRTRGAAFFRRERRARTSVATQAAEGAPLDAAPAAAKPDGLL